MDNYIIYNYIDYSSQADAMLDTESRQGENSKILVSKVKHEREQLHSMSKIITDNTLLI